MTHGGTRVRSGWGAAALLGWAMGCGGAAECPAEDAAVLDAGRAPPPASTFIAGDAIDLGDVCVAHPSPARSVAVVNAGLSGVRVTHQLSGSGASAFVASSTCGETLAARSVCAVAVRAELGDLGAAAAVLELDVDGERSEVALSARGVSCDWASVSPESHHFADVEVGARSEAVSFSATHYGDGLSEPITSVEISGVDASQFEITRDGCLGHALVPLARCVVDVAYVPTVPGFHSATLQITGFDTGSVPLLGQTPMP